VGTAAPDTEPLFAGIWRILWSQRLEREARRRRLGRDATRSSTCPPTAASSSRPARLSWRCQGITTTSGRSTPWSVPGRHSPRGWRRPSPAAQPR